jgi:hypothetical protein
MPPFAQVYERFALAMHERVSRETAEKVRLIVENMTPCTAIASLLRVHVERAAAAQFYTTALKDFVEMHRMGMLDDMEIDESDTDDTATSYSSQTTA